MCPSSPFLHPYLSPLSPQLSSTEYQLFYGISALEFVRFVGCDLSSSATHAQDNPSLVKNLVKRLSEVSSWITHVIISQPTHEERKSCLSAIMRVVDTWSFVDET